ncbi:MAG TPA: hypothetical protein PLA72_09645 [Smithellaceae bacterium]|nr:hypothetical protein [Smithellaceae bacterium]
MPVKKAPAPYGKGVKAQISFLLNIYNRMVYRFADWHTFPCERLMTYYWQMAPEIKGKSSVIPHIALRKFHLQEEQSKDVFSLCHTGSVAQRDLSVFFEGLKRFIEVLKPSKKIHVIFIGDPVDEIRAKVSTAGLCDIVQVEAPKTYEETQLKAAHSSVLVVLEAQCEEGIFFPSKFVDFVQTGRPLLAISPKQGTLSDILKQHGGGIAVDNRSPEEVCNALNILYESWESDPLMNDYRSNNLFNLFCADFVLKKFNEIFRALRLKGSVGQ